MRLLLSLRKSLGFLQKIVVCFILVSYEIRHFRVHTTLVLTGLLLTMAQLAGGRSQHPPSEAQLSFIHQITTIALAL